MASKIALAAAGLLAMAPAALACLGYTGGLPTATSTKTNSAVITVAAGEVFDGGWAKYDRGSGACTEQAEGGEFQNTYIHLITDSKKYFDS